MIKRIRHRDKRYKRWKRRMERYARDIENEERGNAFNLWYGT